MPAVVHRFAAGRTVRAIWANELGGMTFRVGSGSSGIEFIKMAPTANACDFADEARRLRRAAPFVTVPQVLDFGVDGDSGWPRTRGLPGLSAVHPRWLASPRAAGRAIGTGLRTLHPRLPVRSCPFDWSASSRRQTLTRARRERPGEPPPLDRLVVCRGDACSPNTLIDDGGHCCGHVDFGSLGPVDRWADLAVAPLSLGWNYPGRLWDEELFAASGIEPDPPLLDCYRRLWQAED